MLMKWLKYSGIGMVQHHYSSSEVRVQKAMKIFISDPSSFIIRCEVLSKKNVWV